MIHPSWHEPRKYYGAKYRLYHKENPKAILFYSTAFFIGFVILGFIASVSSSNPNRPSLLSCIIVSVMGLALLGGFVHGALLFGFPRLIRLSPKGAECRDVTAPSMHPFAVTNSGYWRWEQIAYAAFGTEELFGQAYPVLSLYKPDGSRAVTFGLNPDVAQPKVEAVLRAYNVELRSDKLV